MESNKLIGKVAVITASTRGIGYAIAERLAKAGAKVIISSRKAKNVADAVEKLRSMGLDVYGVVCHVGRDEDRKKLIKKVVADHGSLNILISNAGVNPYFGPFLETPEKTWDKIFDMNLKSSFLLAKEAVPHLRESKGSMLFVSSILGFYPHAVCGAYAISKTALIGLIKALSTDCAPDVRVNGIAPGPIESDFNIGLPSELSELAKEQTLLKRFGRASECAGAAEFLCSDDASYITGEMVVIAGGWQSRL